MLASAPVAARMPLQARRFTISLSTQFHLPAGGGGVNHLAIAIAVVVGGPALEEAPVDAVGPVAVDRIERPVAAARQCPYPHELVAGGRLGQHACVADGNHVVVLRMQDEDWNASVG